MLEALGFGRAEAELYELLVTRGRLALDDVLALGEREAQRIALETLESRGLVRRAAGPEPVYVVAPPEYAIDVLVAEQMAALRQVRARATELAARVRAADRGDDAASLIEVVSGPGSARQLFRQVVRSAREEIAVFDRPPYATPPEEIEEVREEQARRFQTDGVRIRTVFDRGLLDDPVEVRRIMNGVRGGEQARVAPVPLKLAIIDREWGMLPLLQSDAGAAEAVVIVRRSVLLDSMIALFESVWAQASEIRPGDDDAVRESDEADLRELARLLVAGMTDLSIAHHLGLSERTVRRRTKELLDELGAQSRFQAGAIAAKRGWI
ncbi:helix-turn-helix domain-containing protein [Microbacterium lacusdiani]